MPSFMPRLFDFLFSYSYDDLDDSYLEPLKQYTTASRLLGETNAKLSKLKADRALFVRATLVGGHSYSQAQTWVEQEFQDEERRLTMVQEEQQREVERLAALVRGEKGGY